MKRPDPFIIIDQPDLQIIVDSDGGGKVMLHYELSINGQHVHDDSSYQGHTTRRMFPNRSDLTAWVESVETWSTAQRK
jgi:hypothetical protein